MFTFEQLHLLKYHLLICIINPVNPNNFNSSILIFPYKVTNGVK